MIANHDGLKILARHLGEDIVIALYDNAADLMALRPHPLNYFSVGAMGLAASHGLGLALGCPDKRVIVIDGDGSLLMSLGSLVTVAAVAPKNFVHLLWENGVYQANGGHPIPGRARVDFCGLARAAGYRHVCSIATAEALEREIDGVLAQEGPVFAALKIDAGPPVKRDFSATRAQALRDQFKAALQSA